MERSTGREAKKPPKGAPSKKKAGAGAGAPKLDLVAAVLKAKQAAATSSSSTAPANDPVVPRSPSAVASAAAAAAANLRQEARKNAPAVPPPGQGPEVFALNSDGSEDSGAESEAAVSDWHALPDAFGPHAFNYRDPWDSTEEWHTPALPKAKARRRMRGMAKELKEAARLKMVQEREAQVQASLSAMVQRFNTRISRAPSSVASSECGDLASLLDSEGLETSSESGNESLDETMLAKDSLTWSPDSTPRHAAVASMASSPSWSRLPRKHPSSKFPETVHEDSASEEDAETQNNNTHKKPNDNDDMGLVEEEGGGASPHTPPRLTRELLEQRDSGLQKKVLRLPQGLSVPLPATAAPPPQQHQQQPQQQQQQQLSEGGVVVEDPMLPRFGVPSPRDFGGSALTENASNGQQVEHSAGPTPASNPGAYFKQMASQYPGILEDELAQKEAADWGHESLSNKALDHPQTSNYNSCYPAGYCYSDEVEAARYAAAGLNEYEAYNEEEDEDEEDAKEGAGEGEGEQGAGQLEGSLAQSEEEEDPWLGWAPVPTSAGRMFYHHAGRQRSQWYQPVGLNDYLGTWEEVAIPGETPYWRNSLIGISLWKDPRSTTNIFQAAMDGNMWFLQMYAQAEGDCDVRDEQGRSPLHFACAGGVLDVAMFLIGLGVEVDAMDAWGETPLLFSARYGFAVLVQALLNAGADATLMSSSGNTAYHEAAAMGQVDCLRVLVTVNVSVMVPNDEGYTAVDLAARGRHYNSLTLLRQVALKQQQQLEALQMQMPPPSPPPPPESQEDLETIPYNLGSHGSAYSVEWGGGGGGTSRSTATPPPSERQRQSSQPLPGFFKQQQLQQQEQEQEEDLSPPPKTFKPSPRQLQHSPTSTTASPSPGAAGYYSAFQAQPISTSPMEDAYGRQQTVESESEEGSETGSEFSDSGALRDRRPLAFGLLGRVSTAVGSAWRWAFPVQADLGRPNAYRFNEETRLWEMTQVDLSRLS